MARPTKTGLDYFAMDCDFFQDDKIFYIRTRAGILGELAIVKLLAEIYRVGYCYRWNEQIEAIFSVKSGVDIETVQAAIVAAIEIGFFDRRVYTETGFLSSKGIQKRYLRSAERRIEIRLRSDVLLINELPENCTIVQTLNSDDHSMSTETRLMSTETPPERGNCSLAVNKSTQSKVKESKVKESKVNNNGNAHVSGNRKTNLQKIFDSRSGDWLSLAATESLEDWIQFRRELKKPLTASSLKQILKKYALDVEKFRAEAEQSIRNGWQGLFELKQAREPGKNQRDVTLETLAYYAQGDHE